MREQTAFETRVLKDIHDYEDASKDRSIGKDRQKTLDKLNTFFANDKNRLKPAGEADIALFQLYCEQARTLTYSIPEGGLFSQIRNRVKGEPALPGIMKKTFSDLVEGTLELCSPDNPGWEPRFFFDVLFAFLEMDYHRIRSNHAADAVWRSLSEMTNTVLGKNGDSSDTKEKDAHKEPKSKRPKTGFAATFSAAGEGDENTKKKTLLEKLLSASETTKLRAIKAVLEQARGGDNRPDFYGKLKSSAEGAKGVFDRLKARLTQNAKFGEEISKSDNPKDLYCLAYRCACEMIDRIQLTSKIPADSICVDILTLHLLGALEKYAPDTPVPSEDESPYASATGSPVEEAQAPPFAF